MLRAAVIGLALAAAAVPVQAGSSIGFPFGFGFRNDDGLPYRTPRCPLELSDSQLRRAVARQGYSRIYLNVANERRIQVRATKGGTVYLLRVSTCTGEILEKDALRPS
jgi:hypothetical protein